jgi:hypothetical protein
MHFARVETKTTFFAKEMIMMLICEQFLLKENKGLMRQLIQSAKTA